ncbi:MAG: hypothetical protein AAF849_18470 [Bacteroidota bacterium]
MIDTIRTEIDEILSRIPDESLKPILNYLKELEKADKDHADSENIINKIFKEDENLLRRLAQ